MSGRGCTRYTCTSRCQARDAYLSVLRDATAGLAARLDFTLDEIEDLRIAIDEACAMLLAAGNTRHHLESASNWTATR